MPNEFQVGKPISKKKKKKEKKKGRKRKIRKASPSLISNLLHRLQKGERGFS